MAVLAETGKTEVVATLGTEMLVGLVASSVGGLAVDVRRCPAPSKGDWVVELDPGAEPHTCRAAAEKLAGLPGVLRALAIPPRIFLTLSAPLLAETVIPTILREGTRYGDSETGAGVKTLLMFSSPNGNKPLHLGHLRNNAIGMALGNLLESHGGSVVRASVLSDWGIHMAEALTGYLRWAGGATPVTAGQKPDRFIGDLYVRYRRELDQQRAATDGGAKTPLEMEAHDLLARLERGDAELETLNRKLGDWAHEGILETYARIGSRFDHIFRERETQPLAKQLVLEALEAGHCERRDDGSVYVDLTEMELGEITLLRSDGTAVVYAHMLANNVYRRSIVPFDKALSVYGEQWKTGTEVMTAILRRFGYEWAGTQERIHHGMVTLGAETMSSRRGNVVTADALLDEAGDKLYSLLGHKGLDREDCEPLALAFLKHVLLRVPRVKPIAHDEHLLWQRAFPRFGSMARSVALVREQAGGTGRGDLDDKPAVRALLLHLDHFPAASARALREREPHVLARWLETASDMAKSAANFADDSLWRATDVALRKALALLEIDLPDRILAAASGS